MNEVTKKIIGSADKQEPIKKISIDFLIKNIDGKKVSRIIKKFYSSGE